MDRLKSWEEIEDDFVRIEAMSCNPNFKNFLKDGLQMKIRALNGTENR